MEENVLNYEEIFHNIVAALKITVRQLAVGMGVSYAKIFNLYSGRTITATPDVVDALVNTYGISRLYAMTGKGPMFKIDVVEPKIEEQKQESKPETEPKPELMEQPLPINTESQVDAVGSLTKIVASLMRDVQEKDTRIKILEDLLKRNNIKF